MPPRFGLLLCLVVLVIFNPSIVSSDPDPDPMARPTRPKAFTSADELKRYLDLVRDYYSLSGKARYGKRSKVVPINDENPLEILRLPITSTDLITAAFKNNHIIKSLNKINHFSPIETDKSFRDINNDRYGINEIINIKHKDNKNNYQQQQRQEDKENKGKEEKEEEEEAKKKEEQLNDDDDDDDGYNDLNKFQKHDERDLPYLYEAMAKYYDDFQ